MKRLAFLLICVIASQVGCGGDGDDNEVHPVSDYFPLAVGTTWVYGVGTGTSVADQEEVRTTTGLSRRAGVDWYRIGIEAADGTISEIEVAVSDGSLIRRAPGGGNETILLRDPVIPGTQWLNELPEVADGDVADDAEPAAEGADAAADPAADPAEDPATDPAADPPVADGETPADGADTDPGGVDGADPDLTGDADAVAGEAEDGDRTALYEVLSTSDIVVTPDETYDHVVTVRAFTQGSDVVFYQFAADVGIVRIISESVADAAPDSPTGAANTTTRQLQVFSSEPIVAEEEATDAAAGP